MLPIMRQTILSSKKPVVYYRNGVEYISWIEGAKSGDAPQIYTENSGSIYLEANRVSQATYITSVIDVAVDLTKIKRIAIEWEQTGSNSTSTISGLIVSTSKTDNYLVFDARIEEKDIFNRKISFLDVNSFTGSYYLRFHARSMANGVNSHLTVYGVWGVR